MRNLPGDLREQAIGCEVFGRKLDYNCSEDNILRTEARNLRRRLQEYFSEEGLDEPVMIVVPKGAYVPNFQPRPTLEVRLPLEESAVQSPPLKGMSASAWLIAALIAGVVVLSCLCLFLRIESSTLRSNLASHKEEGLNSRPLLAVMFDNKRPTFVVAADSCFSLLQDALSRTVSLDEYLRPGYPASLLPSNGSNPALRLLENRQYTSLADLNTVARILRASGSAGSRLIVRYARNFTMRDLVEANVILLGSRRSNPWVELFESQLNFTPEYGNEGVSVRNKVPLAGESAVYEVRKDRSPAPSTYGVVALLPNLREGNVLLLQGAEMRGTEAAGDFIDNPVLSSQVVKDFGLRNRMAS